MAAVAGVRDVGALPVCVFAVQGTDWMSGGEHLLCFRPQRRCGQGFLVTPLVPVRALFGGDSAVSPAPSP